MLERTTIGLCSAAIFSLATIGAASAQTHISVGIGVPLPPGVEFVTGAPAPGYVWAPGYWAWNGVAYVWVEGRWLLARSGPPFVGAHSGHVGPHAHFAPPQHGHCRGHWH